MVDLNGKIFLFLIKLKKKKIKDNNNNDKSKDSITPHPKTENFVNSNDDLNDSEKPFTHFEGLNFEIKKGELIIVTGPIGCGKTSLLNTMAGFMKMTSGRMQVNGDLLLCCYPWILNATVKDNILFGSPYHKEKYKEVLRVCSLEDDLKILPTGDMTEIGERGITLSGGQKARINLARAVYKTKDIFLFDDVLSAVDSRVGKHIMDECMLGLLKSTTKSTSCGVTGYYLEYNSTINISSTGTSISSRLGSSFTVPFRFSRSASNHSGTRRPPVTSTISLYLGELFLDSLISITSPALIR